MIRAVLWDFGGVFTTSPFAAFRRYEKENGLPTDFIRSVNARNHHDNAWAKFERSDVTLDEFDALFKAETAAQGHEVPGKDIIQLLAGDFRPEMIEALRRCSEKFITACITNNVKVGSGPAMFMAPDREAKAADSTELNRSLEQSRRHRIQQGQSTQTRPENLPVGL